MNVRDAFPREQMGQVQSAYSRMEGPAGGRGRPEMATAWPAERAVSGGWRGPWAGRRLGRRLRQECSRLAMRGSRRRKAETATRKVVRWRRTAMAADKQLSV